MAQTIFILYRRTCYFSIMLFGHSGSSIKNAMQPLAPKVLTAPPRSPKTDANNFNISPPPLYISKHYCLNHSFYNFYKED